MTKSDLIEVVANKLHLPKGKAELIVNCVLALYSSKPVADLSASETVCT